MDQLIDCDSHSGEIKPTSTLLFGGLLLFFLFEYLRPGTYFPILEVLKLNTVLPVAVFIGTFLSSGGRSNSEILNAMNTKWFLFFLFLLPLQVLTVDVKLYVWGVFTTTVGFFLIYFVIIKQVTNIKRVKAVLFILIIIHVLLILLNPKTILEPENRNYIAGVTFLGDGNDFAWSIGIVLPFALFMAQISDKIYRKVLFMGTFCLLILAVVGSQSRGGTIAVGITIFYLMLKGKNKVLGLVGIGVVITAVLLFAPEAYFERMSTIKDYETEGSAQGRIMAWNSAIKMAADHPFLGVGAGHFAVKYGVEYRPPGIGRTDIPWANAHSIYFLALGEFGLSGLLFLLGLIIFNFRRNERRIRDLSLNNASFAERDKKLAVAMQAAFIGFFVGGAFLSGLYYPHIFVITALMESIQMMINRRDPENSDNAKNILV